MKCKKITLKILCIIVIFLQLTFKVGTVKAVTYSTENSDIYIESDDLYYDSEDIENYSEDYKKYLQLPDEEKQKIRCNTKKI